MENLLPFLAALAYMAYQVFNNYKKGQDEAKSRNPSKPYYQPSKEYPEWLEQESSYKPEQTLDKPSFPEKYHEPVYEPSYREPVVEKPIKEPSYKEKKAVIPRKVELYNPEVPVEEVTRGRAIHAPHKHKFVASHEEEIEYSDFDFQDAIIKEAILNRPRY